MKLTIKKTTLKQLSDDIEQLPIHLTDNIAGGTAGFHDPNATAGCGATNNTLCDPVDVTTGPMTETGPVGCGRGKLSQGQNQG